MVALEQEIGERGEVGMHLRTIYRDGWLCTAYAPSTRDVGGLVQNVSLRGAGLGNGQHLG